MTNYIRLLKLAAAILLLTAIAALHSLLAQNGAGSYLVIRRQDSAFIELRAIIAPSTNRFYLQSAFGLDGTNKWGRNDQLPLLSPPQWATNYRQFNYSAGSAAKRVFYRLSSNANATNLIAFNEPESITDTNEVSGTFVEVEDAYVPPQVPTNAP